MFLLIILIISIIIVTMSSNAQLTPLQAQMFNGFAKYILYFFALLSFLSFLSSWFERATTEIVVTDKRIIHKRGWIARRTEEMNITKVETVDVAQNVAGRMLNYGTVLIRGTGGSWEPLRRVAAPLTLRNAIIVG